MNKQPGLNKNSENWLAVVVLTLVAVLTYLPLAPQLGYYYDDWFPLVSQVSGVSLFDMHSVDRPLMGMVYTLTYSLLGDCPFGWHIFGFVLRLAGALVLLWLLRLIYPDNRAATLLTALFFLVYPGFLMQTNANNYSNHLLSLFLGILSLALTVYSFRFQRYMTRKLAILVSAGLILMYPNIYEAMIGMEALRFILLWRLNSSEQCFSLFLRVRRLLVGWLPYLLTLLAFFVYRFLVFKSARVGTDIAALWTMYRSQPLTMVSQIFFEWGRDILETSLLAWSIPAGGLIASARYLDLTLAGICAILAIALVWGYWRIALRIGPEAESPLSRELFWMGLLTVMLSLLPVILSGRDVRFTHNLNRYTLQSAAGAAMLLVALIFYLPRFEARFAVSGLLIGLAVVTHFLNAAYYRDFWMLQKQLWWQLSWRAPDLKDGTVVMALLPDKYRLAEGYEIWAPLNLIYRPGRTDLSLLGETLNQQTLLKLLRQETMGRTNRKITYKIDFKNTLLISMPTVNSCLHVIDGQKPELSQNEDALVRLAAPFSSQKWIVSEGQLKMLPDDIFGAEPEHGWCYYYQRASLARQRGDWDEVLRMGDEVMAKGLFPSEVSEWLPFYEAYAHRRFEEINRIGSFLRADDEFLRSYCASYGKIDAHGDPDETLDEFIVKNLCANPEDYQEK
jgi:hypothetical protein